MLIPSHKSIHINLINLNDSSLCHAQIEIYQRPLLLQVSAQASGMTRGPAIDHARLPVTFHKGRDTELPRLPGSRLALRNLYGPEGCAEACLLMLLEDMLEETLMSLDVRVVTNRLWSTMWKTCVWGQLTTSA